MKKILTLIVLALVPFGVIAAIVFVIVFIPETDTTAVTASQFVGYVESANVYRARMTEFLGVCTDIGLPAQVECQDAPEAYRLVQALPEGGLYCADSTGFSGEVARVSTRTITCQ